MSSPFRDEVETLRRENEALRAQLSHITGQRSRAPRAGVAFGLLAADVVAAELLRPWLNAASDATFWGALGLLGAITFAAGWAAVGYKRRA